MAAPLLRAEIDINASVETVWQLISDFNRMPEWSPEFIPQRKLAFLRRVLVDGMKASLARIKSAAENG
jgi:uncharacterized membrane protein